jgi:hypothetical protein
MTEVKERIVDLNVERTENLENTETHEKEEISEKEREKSFWDILGRFAPYAPLFLHF